MVQGGLKKVQGGLEPPLAPHFPRLCNLQTTDIVGYMRSNFAIKNLFLFFWHKKIYQQNQVNDIPTIILNLLK